MKAAVLASSRRFPARPCGRRSPEVGCWGPVREEESTP